MYIQSIVVMFLIGREECDIKGDAQFQVPNKPDLPLVLEYPKRNRRREVCKNILKSSLKQVRCHPITSLFFLFSFLFLCFLIEECFIFLEPHPPLSKL